MLSCPRRPVEVSTMPLCEFLVNMIEEMSAQLVSHIHDLIRLQETALKEDSEEQFIVEEKKLSHPHEELTWRIPACDTVKYSADGYSALN